VYVYPLSVLFFLHSNVDGQVVELDAQYRQRVHTQQLHTYFYGQTITPPLGLSITSLGDADFDGHLAPSSSVIPFGELTFLRIGESKTPISLRPVLSPSSPAYFSLFKNRWHRHLPSRLERHVP
jgi:hypothetical protein